MSDGSPEDPVSETLEAALSAHELYLTYCQAGFSSEQALYLVAQIVTAGLRKNNP